MDEIKKEKFTGTVIWFNIKKGTGFLKRDDGKKDIFVFYSDINMEGFKTLNKDDKVTFEEDISFHDRLKAANVTVIEKASKK